MKTATALAASVLSGNVDLGYLATTGAIAKVGDDWVSAGKGFTETQAVRVTCESAVSRCAGGDPSLGPWSDSNPDGYWALPSAKEASLEDRMNALEQHGFTIEFLDQIPSDAKNLATNGILNDLPRASQVFVGYTERQDPSARGTTFYLQYNQSHGGISDLMQAGWDKFISPLTGEYSATSTALAFAITGHNSGEFDVLGHSWGSITTRNSLVQAVDAGYANPDLSVAVFGAAVRPTPLVESMKAITGKDISQLIGIVDGSRVQLTFLDHPNDPVSSFVGMNVFPSQYLDPSSPNHIPGASQNSVWGSLKGFGDVFGGTINPHSCQGLNCMYNPDMHWTVDRAIGHGEQGEKRP